MQIRFDQKEIRNIAKRYDYPKEATLEKLSLKRKIELTKSELKIICDWKSPRSANHVNKNTDEYVREITAFVFRTKNERAKIEALTLLDGVGWPTASVILHWFHQAPYPIIDFRALWSVKTEVPPAYTFDFWQKYVAYCRKLVELNKVSMRILDKALWQYSYENQKA